MTWDDSTWEAFCSLLEEAWPGDFDDDAARSWRVLLDQVEPVRATGALRRLLLEGRRFRPSVSELLAEVHADPSMPTFEEAWVIIRRAIAAPALAAMRRDQIAKTGRAFVDEETSTQLRNEARVHALDRAHLAVHRFVGLQGWDRLGAALDEEWGPARLAELRKAWEAMVDAGDTRQIAAIASGRPDGLRQLDPVAMMGIPGAAPQLEAGPTA